MNHGFMSAAGIMLYVSVLGAQAFGAARSVKVIIKNDTDQAMVFTKLVAKHGIISQKPPSRIPARQVGVFKGESQGVATGTEGWINYRLEGVQGEAVFHWDNPFAGSNSADALAPGGYHIEQIGDKGNRTLVFFSIHPSNRPMALCAADWIIGALGKHAEDSLDPVSEGIGFITTPMKRMGLGGWVDTGCDGSAKGWPVRDAQYSTDGFWTIDVKLQEFTIGNRSWRAGGEQRFVRIEVEPKTPAHDAAHARANQLISFHGRVLIDTHHGDELVEVHPWDKMVAVGGGAPIGSGTCAQGFVWREATPEDHICVSPSTRDQTKADNARAGDRKLLPSFDNCKPGFVWREATPTDHVCVTPQTRAAVADDNRHAAEHRMN